MMPSSINILLMKGAEEGRGYPPPAVSYPVSWKDWNMVFIWTTYPAYLSSLEE